MRCFLLQDYVTLRGGPSLVVTQTETQWLDLAGFQDIVIFLEVKEFTLGGGTVVIAIETAPAHEDGLFVVQTIQTLSAPLLGLTTVVVRKSVAAAPLARWLRWQVGQTVAGTAWDVTFRIWVAANAPGPLGTLPLATQSALNGGEKSTPSMPVHLWPLTAKAGLPSMPGRHYEIGLGLAGARADAAGRRA